MKRDQVASSKPGTLRGCVYPRRKPRIKSRSSVTVLRSQAQPILFPNRTPTLPPFSHI